MNTIGSVTIWRCIVLNLIIIITSPAKQADRMKVKHNINIIQKEILLLQMRLFTSVKYVMSTLLR